MSLPLICYLETSTENGFKKFLGKSCIFPNFKELQKSLFQIYSHWYHWRDHTEQQDCNRIVETPGRERGNLGVVGSVWNESHFAFLKGVKEVTVYN